VVGCNDETDLELITKDTLYQVINVPISSRNTLFRDDSTLSTHYTIHEKKPVLHERRPVQTRSIQKKPANTLRTISRLLPRFRCAAVHERDTIRGFVVVVAAAESAMCTRSGRRDFSVRRRRSGRARLPSQLLYDAHAVHRRRAYNRRRQRTAAERMARNARRDGPR